MVDLPDSEKEKQMNVEAFFIQAAKDLKLCELVSKGGGTHLVEPYMIYLSATGQRLFHYYQIRGHSKSGQPTGWKNPKVDSFARATIRDETFSPRRGYNPFNYEIFPTVYFSIPTADGRQR